MRLLVILACVALAIANPLTKSINAKAIESVDQNLDSMRPLESGSSLNVDRAKKDVTFCVEVRQDKPVVVDCADRQPIQPVPAKIPAPPPAPEPQPEPQPQPQPNVQPFGQTTIVQPIVIPNTQPMVVPSGGHGSAHPGYVKPQPHTLNIEVPCEPEMAAYVYQPPQEVVYAPTGNCFPQVPSVLQVPTAPATVPASTAPAQVLHIQTGHGLHGLHGQHGLHGGHGLHTLHGAHGLHHSIKPLHTQVVQPSIVQPSVVQPSVVQPSVVQPSIVQPSITQPSANAPHVHTGVQCTCQSSDLPSGTLAKSADGPMNTEALAMKFLQDIQRSAGASGQPMMISGSTPGSTMRYTPMRPMMTMPTSGVAYSQSSSMANSGVGGMGGMYPMGMGSQIMYPGMMRMKSLEDSFTTGPMVPSIRACRDDGQEAAAAAAGNVQEAKPAGAEADTSKSTPSETMDQMKKNNKEDKASRIARYIMEKSDSENQLEDN